MNLPEYIEEWFNTKGWSIHPYQRQMFALYQQQQSVVLIAPTGGGKTLASFLPVICDIHDNKPTGLHTLYISPLKALANDIGRNLKNPIQEMKLDCRIDLRTGDTQAYTRRQQKNKPPAILLTTPESLMLLLTYKDASQYFAKLQTVIIDELHTFAAAKRGDLLALGLAQLTAFAPSTRLIGLSATVERPQQLAQWLSRDNRPAKLVIAKAKQKPDISLVTTLSPIPYSGYMASYAIKEIYQTIKTQQLSIIFVNTRAQAEFVFQKLWQINHDNLPIAIYHGSLSKEQREKTELLTCTQQLKAIVATSALELGIDWGAVDCVLQVGAPKGISRLVQRIGRSNHQFDKASLAKLVPANCFDALECQAAIEAINQGKMDGGIEHEGSLDVVVQFIINCACSQEIEPQSLYEVITKAYPYRTLSFSVFQQLFAFATNGGYVLTHYEQYHRLIKKDKGYVIASEKTARRHRQNIGTIIEAAHLTVKVLNKRKDKILGQIEEYFAQQLTPGDTFMFAGLVVEFVAIRDLLVEVRFVKNKSIAPKIPAYAGGSMPLSTHLAEEVCRLINTPARWSNLPSSVQDWLRLQQEFSQLPGGMRLLVEHYCYKKSYYLTIYCFAGRRAHHTLGMLLSQRMEAQHLMPLSFTVTDYGLAIKTLKPVSSEQIDFLLSKTIINEELEQWLNRAPLLKRSFRQVAIISGLIERQQAGTRKSMKQVTFSSDLIYDVLARYEPNHVLMTMTRAQAYRSLLDVDRLQQLLERFAQKIQFVELPKPSPMAITFLTTFKTETIQGDALDELLVHHENELLASSLMAEVRLSVTN